MAGDTRSILEMSDEEIANLDLDAYTASLENTPEDPPAEDPPTDPVVVDPVEEPTDPKPEDAPASTAAVQTDPSVIPDAPSVAPVRAETPAVKDPQAAPAPEVASDGVDYKAVYDRLTAPFKANGREIQVKNVDDAISLMQMGANYNKKMAALKPNLKLLKLLENNGLLSEEKLGYLIDLDKKNPHAINKLIKDSGIDPMELDAEKAGDYRPTQRTVDEKEMELDAVLDEIQETPSYNRTLGIVSHDWDVASRQVVAQSPQLLKVINSHVQSGIYDLIHAEIESERMFGRLQGLSDIEAYRQVGDAIQARGGFAHLSAQGHQTPLQPAVIQPNPKIVDEDKRKEKRLAASASKSVPTSKPDQDLNPLALSDDEFGKLVKSQYL